MSVHITAGTRFVGAGGIGIRMNLDIDWRRTEVEQQAMSAAAESLKAGAKATQDQAKDVVHVITGTLQNSIHVTNNPNEGDRTEEAAMHDLAGTVPDPVMSKSRLSLWVIANTFYAIYEEMRHPYLYPSMSAAGPAALAYMQENRI